MHKGGSQELIDALKKVREKDWASGPNVSFREWTTSGYDLHCIFFGLTNMIHIYKRTSLEGFEDSRWDHKYARDLVIRRHKDIFGENIYNGFSGIIGYKAHSVDLKSSMNKTMKQFIIDKINSKTYKLRPMNKRKIRNIYFIGIGKFVDVHVCFGSHSYKYKRFAPSEIIYYQNSNGGIYKMEKLYEIDVMDYITKKKLPKSIIF